MKDEVNSKLTACLLVYNHEHLLEKVIASILGQTYSDFDLIISDDCSTDNSYEIARSYEKTDARVIVIKTPENLGMAGNANYAISRANSQFVALLHHDDLLKKETFEKWMNCIESDSSIAFVFNDYETSESKSTNLIINKKLKYVNPGQFVLKKLLLKRWGSPIRGTALMRKKYFNEVGGINEGFGMLADVDLWMRLSSKYNIGYINRALIEVIVSRPENYPAEYTEFSWERIFILFDIHSSNINKENFQNPVIYLYRRFVFRNKVSLEIIKWHFYAVIKRKYSIILTFNVDKNKYEYFYSGILRSLMRMLINK